MRICHFSDWHGQYRMLPKADLYVCTGDMLPNFPKIRFEVDKWRRDGIVTWDPNGHLLGGESQPHPGGTYAGRELDPVREAGMQNGWLALEGKKGGLRRWFATPESPVIIVRGNHDFTDLTQGFQGGPVWEVDGDPTRTTEFLGLKIGGCRGINYIVGEWSDELLDAGQAGPQRSSRMYGSVLPPAGNWDDVVAKLPTDIDILITHAPARGILDTFGVHLGSNSLRRYIDRQEYEEGRLKAHFFGHIHEHHGSKRDGRILFSNAATTHLVYEL